MACMQTQCLCDVTSSTAAHPRAINRYHSRRWEGLRPDVVQGELLDATGQIGVVAAHLHVSMRHDKVSSYWLP